MDVIGLGERKETQERSLLEINRNQPILVFLFFCLTAYTTFIKKQCTSKTKAKSQNFEASTLLQPRIRKPFFLVLRIAHQQPIQSPFGRCGSRISRPQTVQGTTKSELATENHSTLPAALYCIIIYTYYIFMLVNGCKWYVDVMFQM